MDNYSHPHYRQSHAWQRFAHILSDVRESAYERKEEALKWSLERGATGFTIPAKLELEAKDSRGLKALSTRIKGGERFVELGLRERYNEGRDVIEIEATVTRNTRTGTETLRVGLLPEADAKWLRPLLRNSLAPRVYVASTKRTGGASVHTAAEITVAISRPDEQAREWIDIYDARKAKAEDGRGIAGNGLPAYVPAGNASGYAGTDWNMKIQEVDREIGRLEIKANERERQRRSCAKVGREIQRLKAKRQHLREKEAKSRHRKAEKVTAEEFLRESTTLRETCMTDLGNGDYWAARHQM